MPGLSLRVGIVGAGLAGLACAEALAAAGWSVETLDKGRGAGGRMAVRRLATPLGEVAFDHGAQFFTARDPAFRAEVEAWVRAGTAAPWPAAGPEAFVGAPGMNAPLKALAAGLPVRFGAEVTGVARDGEGWRLDGAEGRLGAFDALVVAVPAEQAARLLAQVHPRFAEAAAGAPSEPCWSVMAAFESPIVDAPEVLRTEGPLGWAARNASKPGRGGPEAFVLHGAPDWSRAHLEDRPEAVAQALLSAFAEAIGEIPRPVAVAAHRWRYARSGRLGQSALLDPEARLGLCGDWLEGPRVECAFLSGRALARKFIEVLG